MADSYTSQDTIIITDYQGRFVLSDFADGTVAELSAPNELSTIVTGYNGNCLGAHNEAGKQRQLTLRIVKGSNDDKRLNKNINLWKDRTSTFVPLQASFTKSISHENGSLTSDTVECYFGLPAGQPVQQTDTTGSVEQCVSVYTINFGNSQRSM